MPFKNQNSTYTRMLMVPAVKKENLFLYLFFLTCFFFLLEISFFIQCNKAYLADFKYVSDFSIPLQILPGILYFLMAQCFVHVTFCVIVWGIACLIIPFFGIVKTIQFCVGLWIFTILTVLVGNQYYFPNSKFADLTTLVLINDQITQLIWTLFVSCWCIIIFFAVLECFKKKSLMSSAVIFFIGLTFIFFHFSKDTFNDAGSETKPNVFVIGIDSLRPDFLSFFDCQSPQCKAQHHQSTPFFDAFLKQATVFNEAYTPLARTFPAWVSILTGKYPRENGIRFDLASEGNREFPESLATILRDHGYNTIYATDETRFSNIDKNFGFDEIISSPVGLNDFLIGTFNDFPFSNFLVNTWIGKILFPYSYANRPVFFSYNPDTFINLLRSHLNKQRTKPVFFAIHFCLTHFPYTWASLNGNQLNPLERYEASILRMDQQLRDFFTLLQDYHFLDHALVILLSDHGEALELPGDRITEQELFQFENQNHTPIPRFYPPTLEEEKFNQSAGHGTDVLGLPQYRILLAFKEYGLGTQSVGLISGLISLLDIKNLILEKITSLKTKVSSRWTPRNLKPFFLESDFSPVAIRTVYPEMQNVLLEGINFFTVDPSNSRLTIKPSMGKKILKSKQYAVIYQDWMLALYPQANNKKIPILVNLKTKYWTNDLQSSFARKSPATVILKMLKNFYGNELDELSLASAE